MKKKRILVPIDFSGDSINALEQAIFYANSLQTKLRMIHVHAAKNFEVPFSLPEYDKKHHKTPKDFCEILMRKYQGAVEGEFDYVVREGKIYREIANQAKYNDAYMIVMGTHGASGFEEFFIGSNSFKVVTNAPCPVLTIRHGFTRRELKTIVMPIDETPETKKKVNFVTHLAQLFTAKIHVLGVRQSDDREIIVRIERNVKQVANFINSKKVKHGVEFLSGTNLTTMTIDYASQQAADLIAIMPEQPSSMRNFWMGAYAQQMVNHSPIPVLTIREND
ncbi:MAG: universal stress protein [Bacteroidetes bacterium]|nr:universal stress protein [Bacteroidota bacterium]